MRCSVSCLLLAALSCCGALFGAEPDPPPNVVIVLFDDLAWGQPASFRKASDFELPHFDSLVRDGMQFTDAHSASAVCTPTRYGLLTGRHPLRIAQYGVCTTYSRPLIPTQRMTMASLFKRRGYSTACVGKWHLGLGWDAGRPGKENRVPIGATYSHGPNQLGFDYFCGFTHARNIGTVLEQDRVVAHVEPVENQPLMIEKAVAWLERQIEAKQPFFLYFPMCPPHTPVVPAKEYLGRTKTKDKDPQYGDWVHQGDAMLGQLLATLERGGVAKNTLVIATADNGAEGRPYPPLRASKRSIYDGGHRAPFAARWPGRIAAGSVHRDAVCLNDLFATAAELTDVPLPAEAGEDSVSLLPTLMGDSPSSARSAVLHQSHRGDLAIRAGDWKLIFRRTGERELYNLGEDVGERRDRLADAPEQAARLEALMRDCLDRGRSTPGDPVKNDRLKLPAGLRPSR